MNSPEQDYMYSLLERAVEAKAEQEYSKAVEILQDVIMEYPAYHEAYEELGDVYIALRQIDRAHKALDRAMKLKPKSANAHYLRGFLLGLENKWNLSMDELVTADKLMPNHSEILRSLGWSMYNANRKVQGISILERSRILSPEDLGILSDLGVCYLNTAEYHKAEQVFQEILEHDPASTYAIECLKYLSQIKEVTSSEDTESTT